MSNAKKKKRKVKTHPQAVSQKPKSIPVKKDTVLDFIKGKEIYLALILITIVAFFVYKDFLLYNKAMLYKDIGSDTLNGLYPIFRHTSDYIFSFGLPSWTFNHGMGQNIYPFFFHGPIDVFLYLFGKNNVAYGIGYIEFFKVVAGGMIFFFYLRTLKLTGYVCIVGALIFSFTGFMILGGTWYLFSSDAVSVALLLLAFEKLFKYNSWYLFPIVIALIGMSMPFKIYLFGVFLLIYASFRFLEEKRNFQYKEYFTLLGKMALLGLLGLLISSAFLFENVLQLIESPRGSGGDSYVKILSSAPVFATGDFVHNVTAIMRLFSNDLLGTGSEFKGWQNYLEAPMFYSGLISLLLVPQAFTFLDKRKKIIYGLFLLIWILPVIFPFFRYSFWLFTGNYYRGFSFFVSLALIYISLQALNNIIRLGKINLLILISSAVVFFIILSYPYFQDADINPINDGLLNFVKIFLIGYALLLIAIKIKNLKEYVPILLLIMLCIELGYLSHITVNNRPVVTKEEMNGKTGYNDYSIEAVDYIKKHDKSFFRIDKNYASSPAMHGSLNDGMVQDYYGTSAYSSFNQINYILFLQAVDIARKGVEEDSRWAQGFSGRPVLESISSVKYRLSKKVNYQDQQIQYDSIAKFGDVTVLLNKYYLPFGFIYDHFITRSEFDQLSTTQKDFTLLRAFVVNDNEKETYSGFSKFDLKDTLPLSGYTWDSYRNYIDELKKDSLNIIERGQTFFKASINLEKKKLLFLSIPYDKGWKVRVNGAKQELKLVDAGMTGVVLDKGNNIIELKYTPRFFRTGLIISLLFLILYIFLVLISRRQKKVVLEISSV
jgi:uncharacterized membrane protein YfhO